MSKVMFKKLTTSSYKIIPNLVARTLSYDLSDEQKTFQHLCREFSETELKPIAAELDEKQQFPKEQLCKLSKRGIMGVAISPKYGGSGLDFLSLSVAIEELSRGCASTGVIVSIHNCLYADLIHRYGTEYQKEKYIKPFTTGGHIGAFALSDPEAGSDAGGLTTMAQKDGDYFILNGTKAWVSSAREATAGIIFATVDKKLRHKGISAFIVDFDTEGLIIGDTENKMGIRACSTSDVILNNVCVHKDNLVGKVGEGFKMAMEQLDLGRIGIASQALGIGQAALDTAICYAYDRKAFGQKIINFQAVQIRLAEMATQLEASRLLVRKAAALKDAGKSYSKFSSMGKLSAGTNASIIAHHCVQILGGKGYVKSMPAERHYRDARITEIYGGISDIQKINIARQLMKEYNLKV